MVDENDILKKLVVEEKDLIKETEKLVEEASKYFRIESSGRILFQNFSTLSNKQRVVIVLLGKYFANRLKLIQTPSQGIGEIAKEIGKPVTTLSPEVTDLVRKGYVEYLPGKKYKVAYHRIREIFDTILSTNQKVKNAHG